MADLKSPRLIYLKGWLVLLIAIVSAGLLLLESPTWTTAALLGFLIWSSARFYYFMFYVIEKYVDHGYRFAGVLSFIQYLIRNRK